MNGHRITIAAIIALLCVACLVQTSMTGCTSKGGSGDETADEATAEGTPFFRSSGGDGSAPVNWIPVSDYVLEQIDGMYEGQGLEIEELEKSKGASSAIRVQLAPRPGISESKQLLDGLYLLHNTFPEQDHYIVEISGEGHAGLETDWETLTALIEEGYNFESDSTEAGSCRRRFIDGVEAEEEQADEPPPVVRTESGKGGESK